MRCCAIPLHTCWCKTSARSTTTISIEDKKSLSDVALTIVAWYVTSKRLKTEGLIMQRRVGNNHNVNSKLHSLLQSRQHLKTQFLKNKTKSTKKDDQSYYHHQTKCGNKLKQNAVPSPLAIIAAAAESTSLTPIVRFRPK